jgi:hypothetical protein
MRELIIDGVGEINEWALDTALRSMLAARLIGLSTYGPGRALSIWLADEATAPDETAATALMAAHDPVFLSLDKATIQADGADVATVTIRTPRADAAPVLLLVNGQLTPIPLLDGVGTLEIVSLDPARIVVALKSGSNRCVDQLEVQAL